MEISFTKNSISYSFSGESASISSLLVKELSSYTSLYTTSRSSLVSSSYRCLFFSVTSVYPSLQVSGMTPLTHRNRPIVGFSFWMFPLSPLCRLTFGSVAPFLLSFFNFWLNIDDSSCIVTMVVSWPSRILKSNSSRESYST